MPRLFYDEQSGWWQVPLSGEAGWIRYLGGLERGPNDPPPLIPEGFQAESQQAQAEQVLDEPGPLFENEGPYRTEADRWLWFELAEAFHRGELQPFGADEFDPLAYQVGATCTVPTDHPPPGTLIGTPYACPGTHCGTTPPNNWQSDNAVDIWLYPGTTVRACAAGTVSRTYGYGYSGPPESQFGGSRLHVEHRSGMVSFYQHLERITRARGAEVRQGQSVGRSGFGNCVPHLHFAVSPPFDPRAWARFTYDPNAPPNPPPPAQEPPDEPPPIPRRTADQSWHNLMTAIGPNRRRQKRRLAAARRALRRSLE